MNLIDKADVSDSKEVDDANLGYSITNYGKSMQSSKIVPMMYINLIIVSQKGNINYHCGEYKIQILDYFDDTYFFNSHNTSASVIETNANDVVEYMSKLNKKLKKHDMYIESYTFQLYFKMDYKDYFGMNHHDIYSVENDYDYLFYDEKEFTRYADNMTLLKIKDTPDDALGLQLGNVEIMDNVDITYDDIEDRKDEILFQNCISYDEVPIEQLLGEAEDLIINNEDGFAIGYHRKHNDCILK